jgi:hypothetical protein
MLLGSWRVPVDNIRRHLIGLITRIFITNISSSEALHDILDSIPVTLGDFEKPQAVHYIIHAFRGAVSWLIFMG